MYSKRIIMKNYKWIISCILVASGFLQPESIQAQSQIQQLQYMAYLQGASHKINNPVLSYQYKVILVDKTGNKAMDSASGLLLRYHDKYLDSNSTAMNLKSDGYFFKLEKSKKQAYLYQLAAVEKKLGLKEEDMNNSMLTIPDSLFSKMGVLQVDEGPAILTLTYKIKENNGSIRELIFRINRKDMFPLDIRIVTEEEDRWGSPTGYKKIYVLSSFSNQVDERRVRVNRYVNIDKNNAVLLAPYKTYSLNTFL
jgi:hypothetical protein